MNALFLSELQLYGLILVMDYPGEFFRNAEIMC